MVSVKRQHIIYLAMSLVVVLCVAMMVSNPVFADSGAIKTAIGTIIKTIFMTLQSIMAATAALVILITIFNILTGGSRATEAGIGRLKVAVLCLIGSWLIVPFVEMIDDAGKSAGNNDPSSLLK